MELISSKLINAIGIADGLGVKEVSVDFTKLPRGIIAITGKNGAGKSTFLDGMQPFPCTPSKPRHKLNDIFEDNGSRENVWIMPDGKKYKALLVVDSKNRKTEGFLSVQEQTKWKPVGDAKKNIGPYVEEIEKILGAQSLFFSSVFRGQKAVLFSAKTKKELKEMFEDLLSNLKVIKGYSGLAKDVKDYFIDLADKTRDTIEIKLQPFEDISETKEQLKEMLELTKECEGKIKAQEKVCKDIDKEIKDVEKKILAQKNSVDEIAKLKLDVKKCISRRVGIEAKHREKDEAFDLKMKEKNEKVERIQKLLDNKDTIDEKVKEEVSLKREIETFNQRVEEIDEEREKLLSERKEFTELKIQKSNKERLIESDETLTKNAIEKLNGEISRIVDDNKILEVIPCKETEFPDKCPFVGDAVKAYERLIALKEELADLEKPSEGLVKMKAEIVELDNKLKGDEDLNKKDRNLASEKTEVRGYIEGREKLIIDAQRYTKFEAEVKIAETTLKELDEERDGLHSDQTIERHDHEKTVKEINTEIKSTEDSITIKESKIDDTFGVKLSDLEEKQEDEEGKVNGLREDLLSDQKTIGALEATIDSEKKAKKETEEMQKKLDWYDGEISEWSQLQIACGRERGIIPMEIDDAGPKVSSLSNDLLTQCFGTRYTIKIVTIQAKKKGKGLKEVFDIRIIDSERLKEKSLVDMSGGQEVWINLAIMLGIALYNRENANLKTLWLDEMDGALDASSKINFLAMLRRVLDVGKFNRIFFISHTPELFKAADARLVLGDGKIKIDL